MDFTRIQASRLYLSIITFLLIFLWTYAAFGKWLDIDQYRQQMLNQVFPKTLSGLLVWIIPATELVIALMLCSIRSRFYAYYASLALMLIFTAYISMALSGAFRYTPCSCGGLFNMSWKRHFIFNFLVLFLILSAIRLQLKERRRMRKVK